MEYPQTQYAPVLTRNKDLRAYSRACLKGNWAIMIAAFVMVYIIMMAISIPYSIQSFITSFSNMSNDPSSMGSPEYLQDVMSRTFSPIYFLTMLATMFITPAFAVGTGILSLGLIRTRNPVFNDVFKGFKVFLKAFAVTFMTGLFTFLWSLLFVIPGIIKAFSYSQVNYILADNPNVGVLEAITLSRKMMSGAKWKYFRMNFFFIGWAILATFTLGIGYLWLYPYITTSQTCFYEDVSRRYFAANPQQTAQTY
jgi:uncharacterized membrane protein